VDSFPVTDTKEEVLLPLYWSPSRTLVSHAGSMALREMGVQVKNTGELFLDKPIFSSSMA
jgi:hypothetical protein